MNYKPLPKEFTKYGFQYKQVYRDDEDYCIYSQSSNDKVIAYECFRTKVNPAFELHGNVVESKEFFPGHGNFGNLAFSCISKDRALEKIKEMKEHRKNLDNTPPEPEIKTPKKEFTVKEFAELNNINNANAANYIRNNPEKIIFVREQTKEEKSGRGKPAKIYKRA
jgi:hypothetical protein